MKAISPVRSLQAPRVLIVSNSQGTAAGLPEADFGQSYPHLLRQSVPDADYVFFTMSSLSVETVDELFREVVLQNLPDVAVFQLGIIECGSRILPPRLKDLFRGLPFGRVVTKIIHLNQQRWRKFLGRHGVVFVDMSAARFRRHVTGIMTQCAREGVKPVFVRIPLLPRRSDLEWFVDNNSVIEKYNDVLSDACGEHGVDLIEPFGGRVEADTLALFQERSVHFTRLGHELLARNLVVALSRQLRPPNDTGCPR